MSMHSAPQMSLLAHYDDLCRYTSVLTKGHEKEFKTFVEYQRRLYQKTKDLESENVKLRDKVNTLETEKLRFETQLKHARSLLISGDEKFKQLEKEKNSLERQIALIKELLVDDNHLDNQTKERLVQLSSAYSQQNDFVSRLTTIEETNSLLSSSDCDETSEDVDDIVKSRKRSLQNKYNLGETYDKKKSMGISNYLSVEDVFSVQNETAPKKSNVTFRSNSEPNSSSLEEPLPRQVIRSDSEQIREHALDIRRNSLVRTRTSLPGGRYSSGGKLSRVHSFVTKTFIRAEKCHPCGKMIKFCKQAYKCTDCRINCHPECKDQCPLPCVPVVATPNRGPLGTISDFTSSTAPMIPSLIVHCINEIESRGLEELGLYRVPGSDKAVKELKEKFLKGKNVPALTDVDVHVLCGTVNKFLRSLKDSLVTKALWHSFVTAANHADENMRANLLYDSVCDLPQPNRETLAFLILHLQRVAASPLCKMPISNLAKVFGPTIVGYSMDQPADDEILMETEQQTMVMEGLLKIPADSWQNLLNCETNAFNPKLRTPESIPAPMTSRLGPIYATVQKSNTITPFVKTTSFVPRSTRTRGQNGKKSFFLSPSLK